MKRRIAKKVCSRTFRMDYRKTTILAAAKRMGWMNPSRDYTHPSIAIKAHALFASKIVCGGKVLYESR